ncbi:hypothetical protein [Dictyobacter kobayashii]|uniref:Uncharacterized protein n=1 Tax=Dictyobacter kobayashii TaxID=2014872 RepID=A0A402AXH0_9CHLR|nr:hypothetical protein [Dictyobacter kobayashii]GCE23840.1 hypothetical protein KDK_76400 [Dictyobacter kobayashii]
MELIFMSALENPGGLLWEAGACLLGIFCSLVGYYGIIKWIRYRKASRYYRGLCESLLHFQHVSSSEQQA